MHIGIDACCWSNRRGFGRYTRELATRMIEDFPEHRVTLVVDRWTASDASFPQRAAIEVVATTAQPTRAASATGSRSPLDLWRLGRAVARLPIDAFFVPAVYSYFPIPRRIPTAIVFHDAIAERHPELIFSRRLSRWMWGLKIRLALRQATRLLTVSEEARRVVAATFRRSEESIAVTGEGVASCFRPCGDQSAARATLARLRLPGETPLLLYVGGISPHKNLEGLLRGLDVLRRGAPVPWHLAIVGDFEGDSFRGCFPAVRDAIDLLGLGDRVSFTGFVPDEELVDLYGMARALVLPSFEEGFGLPAAEAMACGVPVACSRAGALPEVVGAAGALFDPRDPADIAAVLGRLLADDEWHARLGDEGLRRSRDFCWSNAAGNVFDVLRSMTHDREKTPAVLHGDHVPSAISLRR